MNPAPTKATPEEMHWLSVLHGPDPIASAYAAGQLLRLNEWMINFWARRYAMVGAYVGLEVEDLEQIGRIRFLQTIKRYDLEQDSKISGFIGRYYIRAAMRDAIKRAWRVDGALTELPTCHDDGPALVDRDDELAWLGDVLARMPVRLLDRLRSAGFLVEHASMAAKAKVDGVTRAAVQQRRARVMKQLRAFLDGDDRRCA